jgi:hypothetical protein
MENPPSRKPAREVVERVAEAALSTVPLVGGPAAVAFGYAVGQAFTRRQQAWFEDLAVAITALQDADGSPSFEDIAGNPRFMDAVVSATRAAQATHDEEKLRALRNGTLNTLGPDSTDEEEQLRFFRLIEQFGPAHLRLLAYLHDPGAVFDRDGVERPQDIIACSRGTLLERGVAEFAGRGEWYELLARELNAEGLTATGALGGTQSFASLWQSVTTTLGNRFLAFVADPQPTAAPGPGGPDPDVEPSRT